MIWLLTLFVQPAFATPATDAQMLCSNTTTPPALEDPCDCVLTGKGGWYMPFTSADITDLNDGQSVSTSGTCFDFYTVVGNAYNMSNPPSNYETVWNGALWLVHEYVDNPITSITEDIGISTDYSLMGAEEDSQTDPIWRVLDEAWCGPGSNPGEVECSFGGSVQATIIGGSATPDAAFVGDFNTDGYADIMATFTFGEVWLLPGPLGGGALFSPPPPPGP